jgi:Pyruvate/2-oxoacid:ferredoxin oxidoreductase delta subunit
MSQTIIVAGCDTAGEALQETERQAAAGDDVLLVPVLYCLSEDSPVWVELRGLTGPVTLHAAMHPRPLRWLLARHGVDAAEWTLLDTRTATEGPESAAAAAPGKVRRLEGETSERWYPIIDGERCTSCGHCLDFCLFGVYARDEGEAVRVCSPDSCKPGCPACSRICPNGAIMFPEYDKDPAIAGAPGTAMSLDAAGRRMYYQRTGRECPTCAQLDAEQLAHVAQDGCCPECGRKLPKFSPVLAEIDALIDRLDRLTEEDH